MSLSVTHVILLSTAAIMADPDRPPPLTFEEHVDYIGWFNEFTSKGKKDNAYELYKGLYNDKHGQGGIPPLEGLAEEQYNDVRGRIWDPEDYPELAAYLQRCGPHLTIFKNAVKHPDYWQPIPPDTKLMIGVLQPHLAAFRQASKTLIVQAWSKQDDQPEALMSACQTVLRNADHLRQGGFLISTMVSIAERALVYQNVGVAIDEKVLAGKDLTRMYRTIRRYDAPTTEIKWLPVEWALQLDLLQAVAPGGKLDVQQWRVIVRQIAADGGASRGLAGTFDPRETARLIDDHFQKHMNIIAEPMTLKTARKLERFEEDQRPVLRKHAFLGILMPSFSRAYQLQLRVEADRHGTLLALAIHVHHAKHGEWPRSLKKIDKKLGCKGLKKLRKDPFSGKYFMYRIEDGKPLLYSVASDGRDDDGRHDPKWGEGAAGGDYVFWPYQRSPSISRRP